MTAMGSDFLIMARVPRIVKLRRKEPPHNSHIISEVSIEVIFNAARYNPLNGARIIDQGRSA
jgi:hypothetical protein